MQIFQLNHTYLVYSGLTEDTLSLMNLRLSNMTVEKKENTCNLLDKTDGSTFLSKFKG